MAACTYAALTAIRLLPPFISFAALHSPPITTRVKKKHSTFTLWFVSKTVQYYHRCRFSSYSVKILEDPAALISSYTFWALCEQDACAADDFLKRDRAGTGTSGRFKIEVG